ncbi:MAG: hypothetical protein C0405_12500 [Desulfovibrio sp.]|nr:hypothetical protein [Desulfovibrio sp.]
MAPHREQHNTKDGAHMKRFPKILVATCAALALTSSLALAAEAPKKAKASPAKPAAQPMAMGMGMMAQHKGQMALAGLSPEKQEVAKALMDEHGKAMFPLHQGVYAKNAELEALNAAGSGDSDKAKAVIREISDLTAKMLLENGQFRARLVKETGLRTAPMGHGMMAGGMGGMKGGMMGGEMKCPMMEKMMGGMQHGAAPAPAEGKAAAAKAPAKAEAHDSHAK